MTSKQAIDFVKQHGIVLQSAHGPAPNLAECVAGETIKGSWWAHPKSHEIFRAAEAVCDNPDVLVCKLVDGKITYVHRRLWPALVRLASRFPKDRLAKIREEHTKKGHHVTRSTPFPEWVPEETRSQAERLSVAEAESLLGISTSTVVIRDVRRRSD